MKRLVLPGLVWSRT